MLDTETNSDDGSGEPRIQALVDSIATYSSAADFAVTRELIIEAVRGLRVLGQLSRSDDAKGQP
jgi:hypothetical protein